MAYQYFFPLIQISLEVHQSERNLCIQPTVRSSGDQEDPHAGSRAAFHTCYLLYSHCPLCTKMIHILNQYHLALVHHVFLCNGTSLSEHHLWVWLEMTMCLSKIKTKDTLILNVCHPIFMWCILCSNSKQQQAFSLNRSSLPHHYSQMAV